MSEFERERTPADYGWNTTVKKGGMSVCFLWRGYTCVSVENELDFAALYRWGFLENVACFSDAELESVMVAHPGYWKERRLSDANWFS
ncbi:MAG: hypothetical protein MI784_18015 [Cytophagales bacterium]|nr:hypothetical protein [Cytophagales bacterium]